MLQDMHKNPMKTHADYLHRFDKRHVNANNVEQQFNDYCKMRMANLSRRDKSDIQRTICDYG